MDENKKSCKYCEVPQSANLYYLIYKPVLHGKRGKCCVHLVQDRISHKYELVNDFFEKSSEINFCPICGRNFAQLEAMAKIAGLEEGKE